MKFITYNDNLDIHLIHNMPFDKVNGLGKTEEELLKLGALVNEIPEIDVPKDKIIKYKYNPSDNTVYYELIDRPLTIEEENKKQLIYLKNKSEEQDELIKKCLLSIHEMFNLIEPVLLNDNINHINEIKK